MRLLETDGCDIGFHNLVDEIAVRAISPLSEVGAVSWGGASDFVKSWPQIFTDACERVLDQNADAAEIMGRKRISTYARLSILRAAYYTIMMRAATEIVPGLTEDSRIDTALVYMA